MDSSQLLERRPIADQYKLPVFTRPFGYIYCIENKISHKKYIGSVYSSYAGVTNPGPYSQLYKRAGDYIYEYNHSKGKITSAKMYIRPIIRAMIDEGIENFVMYPIAETTIGNHHDAERYFIKLFDTTNTGYNGNPGGGCTYHRGRKMMAYDKRIRSNGVISINLNSKQIIVAESMKLFGDYLNTSKDMIKNSVRNGRPYKGWFSFYMDSGKREYIINNVVLRPNQSENRRNARHSKKSQAFYKELSDNVSLYLRDHCSPEYFSDFEILPPLIYDE